VGNAVYLSRADETWCSYVAAFEEHRLLVHGDYLAELKPFDREKLQLAEDENVTT
jgi:hypothetical protein